MPSPGQRTTAHCRLTPRRLEIGRSALRLARVGTHGVDSSLAFPRYGSCLIGCFAKLRSRSQIVDGERLSLIIDKHQPNHQLLLIVETCQSPLAWLKSQSKRVMRERLRVGGAGHVRRYPSTSGSWAVAKARQESAPP